LKPSFEKVVTNLCKALIILIILILGARGLYDVRKYSNKLSPVAGGSEEKRVLASIEGYVENGLLLHAGLPDYNYNNIAPNLPSPFIYTHFPQGPVYLGYLYTKICGLHNLGCIRLSSAVLGILCLSLFAWFLLSALNPVKAAIIMSIIGIIPFTSNSMHGFTWHVYAFSLFLVQLGFLLNVFKKRLSLNIPRGLVLFLFGFFQGWISFDWFILVGFSAVPLAFIYSKLNQNDDRKRLVIAILAPTAGFAFAHFLHLIQVSIYYGSVVTAVKDVFGAGLARFGAAQISGDLVRNTAVIKDWAGGFDRAVLFLKYLFVYSEKFFPILLVVTLVLIWIKDASVLIEKPIRMFFKWTSTKQNYYAVLTAFLLSFAWVIVMYHHARHHHPYIVRHQILIYFISVLTVLECITSVKPDDQA
jgi:hypothetical protein